MDNDYEDIWYFVDKKAEDPQNNVKGPLSERDLDVLYRTSEIDSQTFVWRDGMKEWTPIYKIDKLKKTLMESTNELLQIQLTANAYFGMSAPEKKQYDENQKQKQLKQNQQKQQQQQPQQVKPQQQQQQLQSVNQQTQIGQINNLNMPLQQQQTLLQVQQVKQTQPQQLNQLTVQQQQQQQFLQTIAQLQQKNLEQQTTNNPISTTIQKTTTTNIQQNQQELEDSEEDEDQEEEDEEDEEEEYLRNLEENPEKALEMTVENLIKAKFYKNQDGKWNIFDEQTKQWKIQDKEPLEEMKNLKTELFNSLKQSFLTEQKDKQTVNKQQTNNKNNNSNKQQKTRDLTGMTPEQIKKIEKNRKKTKRANQKKKEKKHNKLLSTFIYVKNLPPEISMEEVDQFFSRAGIIRKNAQTQEKKIKIYTDEQQKCKGDALISYAKEESVQIALDMLNEREIKPGYMIFIERAKFMSEGLQKEKIVKKDEQQLNNDENNNKDKEDDGTEPQLEKKRKIDKLAMLKQKQEEKKLFGWEEEDQIEGMRIVILKYMFTLQEAQEDVQDFFKFLEEDVKNECQKIGPVLRIKIYEENPEGVIQVKFRDAISAENCISIMNKRFFAGRQIECFYWDGKAEFGKVKESQEEFQKRVDDFGNWLQSENNNQAI